MNAVGRAAAILWIAIVATGQAPEPDRRIPDRHDNTLRVDALLKAARTSMRANQLNDSIASLEHAARLQPEHPEIYNVLGSVYTLGGSMREAEKAFARAVQLAPANGDYRYSHGRALFELR